jgi:8-oxo-dGTP diphosphatase
MIPSTSLLAHSTDPFGGILIDPAALPADAVEFTARLNASVATWRNDGFRLAWLKVPIALASHVPLAVAQEFVFHHAVPNYVMLTLQLREGAFVPSDASHFIGAGAVVVNERREILVIVERYHAKDRPNFYKMPGGLIDPGEHLADGVMREVREECGIETRFESVVCFRHQHGYRFGKSDFYFVCRLSPLSEDIVADPNEIADARWMPVDEYLTLPHVSTFNQHIVRAALETRGSLPTTVEGYTVDPRKTEIYTAAG